jgi:hypothetical protein
VGEGVGVATAFVLAGAGGDAVAITGGGEGFSTEARVGTDVFGGVKGTVSVTRRSRCPAEQAAIPRQKSIPCRRNKNE